MAFVDTDYINTITNTSAITLDVGGVLFEQDVEVTVLFDPAIFGGSTEDLYARMDDLVFRDEQDNIMTKDATFFQILNDTINLCTVEENYAAEWKYGALLRMDHRTALLKGINSYSPAITQVRSAPEVHNAPLTLNAPAKLKDLFTGQLQDFLLLNGSVRVGTRAIWDDQTLTITNSSESSESSGVATSPEAVIGQIQRLAGGRLDTIEAALAVDVTALDSLQEVVDFVEQNRDDLDTLTIENIAGLSDALASASSGSEGVTKGEWTPDLILDQGRFSVSKGVSARAEGTYKRTGDTVRAEFGLNFDSVVSVEVGDRLLVSGLPFNSESPKFATTTGNPVSTDAPTGLAFMIGSITGGVGQAQFALVPNNNLFWMICTYAEASATYEGSIVGSVEYTAEPV